MTSIEWLITWMTKNQYFIGNDLLVAFEQAEEMHKQEIIDAFKSGNHTEMRGGKVLPIIGEQYYQEAFGSKGSDAKDVVLGYKTSLEAQMLDSQLPKTTSDKWKEYQDWLNEIPELSDEEIEKESWKYCYENKISTTNVVHWITACKWYRKQLKQKL